MLTAFLSYNYRNDKSEQLASDVSALLRTLEVKVIDGKTMNPTDSLNTQIKERISQAHMLVAIQLQRQGSQYVSQELGYALGQKIPAIVVTDNDSLASSLVSDQYLIDVKRGGLSLATDLISATIAIKTKRAMSTQPTYSQHSVISEIDSEGWIPEVREQLGKLRELISSLQFSLALVLADQLIRSHPDCWRAYIAKSACLVHLYRYDDAQYVLDEIVNKFSSHRRALSYAYQNIGWVSQRRTNAFDVFEAERRVKAYRMSVSLEPRLVVFLNLIYNLLSLDRVDDAEAELTQCLGEFPDAKEEFLRQVELQGAEFVQQIAKSKLISVIVFPRSKNGGDSK